MDQEGDADRWLTPRVGRAAVTSLVIVAIALAGCGGSSKTTASTSATTAQTTPETPFEAAASSFVHAVATRNCPAIAALSTAGRLSPVQCQAVERFGPPSLGRLVGYGAGAVADLRFSRVHATAVFVALRGVKHGWHYVFLLLSHRSTVTTPPGILSPGSAAISAVLKAIAAGKCKPVVRYFALSAATLARLSPTNCYGHAGPAFRRLVAAGAGQPQPMGGNSRVVFYQAGLGPQHAPFTFVLEHLNSRLRYIGAFPTPAVVVAAQRRRAPAVHAGGPSQRKSKAK
jgi:hypothetical protein